MKPTGYATVTVQAFEAPGRRSLTDALGCEHVSVEATHLAGGEVVSLPTDRETVCVPLPDGDTLALAAAVRLSHRSVGFVPSGVDASLEPDGAASAILVHAQSAPSADGDLAPVVVHLDECNFPTPSTSDIPTARLTGRLGCGGMKVNARRLPPGGVVPYHTEGTQEEVFVPVDGPASMRIDDDRVETPPGTVARVAPQTPRSALNPGDTDALWVMFGAPPTGGPDEWDPGAEILE